MVAAGVKIKVALPDLVWLLKVMARCQVVQVDTAAAVRHQAPSGVNLVLAASAMSAMGLEAIRDEISPGRQHDHLLMLSYLSG